MSHPPVSPADPLVRARLDRFRATLRPQLAALPAAERDDLLCELEAHVLDAAGDGEGDLAQRLDAAIAALGPAEAYLPELVAELGEQRRAARGAPLPMLRLLLAHAGRGVLGSAVLMVSGVLLLVAVAVAACALAALVMPDAGLYMNSWEDFTLTFVRQTYAPKVSNARFVPLALLFSAALYFAVARATVWTLRRLWRPQRA